MREFETFEANEHATYWVAEITSGANNGYRVSPQIGAKASFRVGGGERWESASRASGRRTV